MNRDRVTPRDPYSSAHPPLANHRAQHGRSPYGQRPTCGAEGPTDAAKRRGDTASAYTSNPPNTWAPRPTRSPREGRKKCFPPLKLLPREGPGGSEPP